MQTDNRFLNDISSRIRIEPLRAERRGPGEETTE